MDEIYHLFRQFSLRQLVQNTDDGFRLKPNRDGSIERMGREVVLVHGLWPENNRTRKIKKLTSKRERARRTSSKENPVSYKNKSRKGPAHRFSNCNEKIIGLFVERREGLEEDASIGTCPEWPIRVVGLQLKLSEIPFVDFPLA